MFHGGGAGPWHGLRLRVLSRRHTELSRLILAPINASYYLSDCAGELNMIVARSYDGDTLTL